MTDDDVEPAAFRCWNCGELFHEDFEEYGGTCLECGTPDIPERLYGEEDFEAMRLRGSATERTDKEKARIAMERGRNMERRRVLSEVRDLLGETDEISKERIAAVLEKLEDEAPAMWEYTDALYDVRKELDIETGEEK